MFLLLSAVSCSKPDEVERLLGDDPDSRISDTLAYVRGALVDAPHGWNAYLMTEYSGGYGFFMEFDEKNRVTMMADLNDATASSPKESTYRVRQIMSATLSFDTYNYLTMLQDPDPSAYGGLPGRGFGSDVEFNYLRTSGDTLVFEGRKFGEPLLLVKATEPQKQTYNSEDYLSLINRNKLFFKTNPLTSLMIGNLEAEIAFNFPTKQVSLISAGSDNSFSSISASFCNYADGLAIIDDLVIDGVQLKRFVWKNANTMVAIDSEGSEYAVKINSSSVVPYLLALGTRFSTITVPDQVTYGGWSQEFIDRLAATKAGVRRWNIGGASLIVNTVDFRFQTVNSRMSIVFNIRFGTNTTTLTYNYTYAIENGRFKFMPTGTPTGNEGAIYNDVRYLLQERLEADNFELGYFVNSSTGEVMSQFKSVEHPEFYFTGQNN